MLLECLKMLQVDLNVAVHLDALPLLRLDLVSKIARNGQVAIKIVHLASVRGLKVS